MGAEGWPTLQCEVVLSLLPFQLIVNAVFVGAPELIPADEEQARLRPRRTRSWRNQIAFETMSALLACTHERAVDTRLVPGPIWAL